MAVIRLCEGWTADDIARTAGVSVDAVYSWMAGRRRPRPITWARVVCALRSRGWFDAEGRFVPRAVGAEHVVAWRLLRDRRGTLPRATQRVLQRRERKR
jgi:hypothetical protein